MDLTFRSYGHRLVLVSNGNTSPSATRVTNCKGFPGHAVMRKLATITFWPMVATIDCATLMAMPDGKICVDYVESDALVE